MVITQHLRIDHPKLGPSDFAGLFGASEDSISQECRDIIDECDFQFRHATSVERDEILLTILKRLDTFAFNAAGEENQPRWEDGWRENLRDFLRLDRDLDQLIPRYWRPGQPLRLRQSHILPFNNDFEYNWFRVFRLWLFQTYLGPFDSIYEFGCGPGYNLPVLAELYPDKRIYGLDWAKSSVEIANELASTYGWDIHGILFDFFDPDSELRLDKNSVVMTIGALEQTGRNYGKFLDYLMYARPKLCIHIEPIVEWYDENNLIDYTAIRFHKQRKYLEGLPNALIELEREGKAEILKQNRTRFGSLFHEGFNQLIWRPTP